MGYLRSMCNKTGREWVKSDWVLKEYGLSTKVSGQYNISTLRLFGHIERIGTISLPLTYVGLFIYIFFQRPGPYNV